GARGALDLTALAAPLGDRPVVGGVGVRQLALRVVAGSLAQAARLGLGVLAHLRRRRERGLLAFLDERVGTCLGVLQRVLGFGAERVGFGALGRSAVALGLCLPEQHADLLALRLRGAHRARR